MDGVTEYNNTIDQRIQNIIDGEYDIPCLKYYVSSLTNKSNATIYNYLNVVIKFIRFANKEVEDIRYDDYVSFMATRKDYTSSYQITTYAALCSFAKYLYASDRVEKNYTTNLEAPKNVESVKTKQRREKSYLTKKEIDKYIDNIKNSLDDEHVSEWDRICMKRDLALITLMITTGARCSAVYKMDVDNIDFENKVIVTFDKERRVESYVLTDTAIKYIKDYLAVRKVKPDCRALFVSRNGLRLDQSNIARITKRYGTFEGKTISPHKLRATYGTQIYEQTHDLYMVQKCMGHHSPTTSELYIRGQENTSRKDAANIMSNIIK